MRLRLLLPAAALLLLQLTLAALLGRPALADEPAAGPADIHHVYPGQSIQTAIHAATTGDTVLVHAGTYTGHITKRISLVGFGSGDDGTIINGNWQAGQPVLFVGAPVARDTEISGLRLMHGDAQFGGCICMYAASPPPAEPLCSTT